MQRLILTGGSGTDLARTGLADLVIASSFKFASLPLPPPHELAAHVAAGSDQGPGQHWSDYVILRRRDRHRWRDASLVEFCASFEVIELWFDSHPNDQLELVWLIDHFRPHPELVAKLRVRIVDFDFLTAGVEELKRWKVFDIPVREAELETASRGWRAYCAPTPEACVELLRSDLSALPLLRLAVCELVDELPSGITGLGATEMRVLEMIAAGFEGTNALFHLRSLRGTRVFGEFEIGYLLHGLAHGPRPAIAGLDEALRTIPRENLSDRHAAYLRSRLSLTEFGRAVVAFQDDFSRHNPIDRWWGGTRLTNENLWRWNHGLVKP